MQPRHSVAVSMIATLLGTALISPLYPLYQDRWGLNPSDISNVYVIYMMGALFGLVFLGRLGDRMGFRATLLVSLLLSLIGSVICMAAQEMVLLSIGRALVGISGTLATSSGVAGLNILAPEHKKPHVALKGSLMVASGFGLGPVIGGVCGQWVPMPLLTVHIPVIVMVLIGIVLVLPFITFGVFGLYVSMAPSIVRNVLGLGGPIVSGGGIALMLIGSCLTQIALKKRHYFKVALAGLTLLGVSNVILMINLGLGAAALFALGIVVAAMGHGSSMFAGAQVVNLVSDNTNRASYTASYWAVGYCGSVLPMLGTGMLADRFGLNFAVTAFCSTVVVLCLMGMAAFLLVGTARRRSALQGA
ncbi:MFS transporter [uncultured Brevundimonas sp.]|uniref:MFS transporter n=1 Tax=uncultured Brevundimonas sp. TaxID=213418 RepID=UPI002602BFC0|nr:MFS transporter [uncultured Brevundimonas sp.]